MLMMRINRPLLIADTLALAHLARDRKIAFLELIGALHVIKDLSTVRIILAVIAVLEHAINIALATDTGALFILAALATRVFGVLGALGHEVVAAAEGGSGVVAVGPATPRDGAGDGGGETVDEGEVAVVEIAVGFAGGEVAFDAGVA